MEDVFKTNRQYNYWDNLFVDVQEIYKKHPPSEVFPAGCESNFTAELFRKLYKSTWLPIGWRRYIRKLARQTSLDLGWFHDFSCYWSTVLGGRPLWGVHDFYFLVNLYRVRFQDNQIPDTNDLFVHLEAWQRPELLYQLLHLVYKETAVDYAPLLGKMFNYRRQLRSFLEFGCGTAPVTASFFEFFGPQHGIKVYFSDIQTIAFHYAAHRFAHHKNAIPLMLAPANGFKLLLKEPLDAITCVTVFEHLDQPLETMRDFHSLLAPRGLFLFDYIKSEGEGMDTLQGVRERDAVLDFVADHFDILEGELTKSESTGLIVARKK